MCLTNFMTSFVYAKEEVIYKLSEGEKNFLEEIFDEREVPYEKRQNLIDKLERGELWDSMKDEYSYLKPQVVESGYTKTIYPDGSFLIKGQIDDITNEDEVSNSQLNQKDKVRVLVSGSLSKLGVDVGKKQDLINKFERGEIWDSFKVEYKDLKPQYKCNGFSKTIYPDGSVSIKYAESDMNEYCNLPNSMQARGRKLGSAYADNGLVAMYFEVDYRQNSSTNQGEILSIHSYNTRVLLGNYEEEAPGHEYGWKNPTHAWYASKVTFYSNIASRRFWLKYYVNGMETWQGDNFYL